MTLTKEKEKPIVWYPDENDLTFSCVKEGLNPVVYCTRKSKGKQFILDYEHLLAAGKLRHGAKPAETPLDKYFLFATLDDGAKPASQDLSALDVCKTSAAKFNKLAPEPIYSHQTNAILAYQLGPKLPNFVFLSRHLEN